MGAKKQISLFSLLFLSFACFANETKGVTTPDSTPQSVQPTLSSNKKPIAIDADNQQIDIEKNSVTFSGNVVIVQDGLNIKADKVVITDMQDSTKQKITAYGKPIKFTQTIPEKDRVITGHSNKLIYDVKSNFVTLIGNAEIVQQDNHINSALITYDMNKQLIFAQPGKKERVKTVIVPNQIKRTN
ncbi:lipopolysaccharide transport periplasmic protein LptA [Orbaceae bacterium ESL0721]|nr:lipopolysaccharide transport periplasmic protein LptA [Orbaceae bacterium ESL0721]